MRQATIDPRWHEAVRRRLSRRVFDGRAVPGEHIAELARLCIAADGSGVRVEVTCSFPDDLFQGVVGGYARVIGAGAVAVVVAEGERDLEVGYFGETLVLTATALGLESCWVAGTFDPQCLAGTIPLVESESIRAVIPLGFAGEPRVADRVLRGVVGASRRLPLEKIAPGHEEWPSWAQSAVESVRLAPSGGNGQPWRFGFENDRLVMASKARRAYWTWRIDMGVAMLHAEIGAAAEGFSGRWEVEREPFEAVLSSTR